MRIKKLLPGLLLTLVSASAMAETMYISNGSLSDARKFGVVDSIQVSNIAMYAGSDVMLEATNSIVFSPGSGSTLLIQKNAANKKVVARIRNISETTNYAVTQVTATYATNVRPNAINNNNQVVGIYHDGTQNVESAFIFDPVTNILSPRNQSTYSAGYGVNDSNVLVGQNTYGATRWSGPNSTYQELHLPGYTLGQENSDSAYGISSLDTIVGQSYDLSIGSYRAALWEKITTPVLTWNLRSLPAANGLNLLVARDINSSNYLVGVATNASGQQRAFRSLFVTPNNTSVTDLGVLLGGNASQAKAINSANSVVGWSNYVYAGTQTHPMAFLHKNATGMVSLGALDGFNSFGQDLNDSNIAVGFSNLIQSNGIGVDRACKYLNGSVWDLNLLIPANTGWVLEHAESINNGDYIVGTGKLNGVAAGFLLVPQGVANRSAGKVTQHNQPPMIESAPWAAPAHIRVTETTSVNVVAFDPDNGPEPLTYTWSKVSGPGVVTFSTNGTPDAASSTAAFDQPGNYVLRVSVSDGLDETTGDVTVSVGAAKKK